MHASDRLLIVVQDAHRSERLKSIFSDAGYTLAVAENFESASDVYSKILARVVLVDLASLSGDASYAFVQSMVQRKEPPVVVLLIDEKSVEIVVKTSRLGVFDYAAADAEAPQLLDTVRAAFDRAHTQALQKTQALEHSQNLERQLASKRVAENLVRRQNDKFSRTFFSNIHTSFTQGQGVGALTTLISMLAGTEKTPDGKQYLVQAEILDMIFANQNAVNQMITMFEELQLLLSQDLVLFDVSLGEFHDIVRDTIYELKALADLRGHRLVLSDLEPRFRGAPLRLNWEFMRKALRELLLNAMKFSAEQSTVTVLVEYLFSKMRISVINKPVVNAVENSVDSLADSRQTVFEPFFRLSRHVHDQYNTLDYGLGLTFVQKVVQMHHGTIRCTELIDRAHGATHDGKLVCFEIELPC